jgi:hypothetical protein
MRASPADIAVEVGVRRFGVTAPMIDAGAISVGGWSVSCRAREHFPGLSVEFELVAANGVFGATTGVSGRVQSGPLFLGIHQGGAGGVAPVRE